MGGEMDVWVSEWMNGWVDGWMVHGGWISSLANGFTQSSLSSLVFFSLLSSQVVTSRS